MSRIAEPLRALLTRLIDYAGLYPPAGLPLPGAARNYQAYLDSPDSWMLNRLVLPAARLSHVQIGEGWRITLLVEDHPGPLPPAVETLETKSLDRLTLPTYCEAPVAAIREGAFAKVRTGGLVPAAIPTADALADFLCEAAARRMPFKATAGLHHPIRSLRPLTYEPDAPRAVIHGFVNVFAAAAFAWHGAARGLILDVLNEMDPGEFQFTGRELRWRDRGLSTAQITAARREFAHSFGSCSFAEPLADLRTLGWLDA